MRPAWRLATSELWGRPARTVLLALAVTLSAALVVSVASALTSANASIESRMEQTVGAGDLKITAARPFDTGVMDVVRSWDEVATVEGQLTASVRLRAERPVFVDRDGVWSLVRRDYTSSARGVGIGGAGEAARLRGRLVEGRLARDPGEVVIDELLAEKLGWTDYDDERYFPGTVRITRDMPMASDEARTAGEREARTHNAAQTTKVGDEITLRRFLRSDIDLTVVGISEQPPLGGRPEMFMSLDGLGELLGTPGRVSEVEIVLEPDVDPEAVVEARRAEIEAYAATAGDSLLLQTSAKVTSGLTKNLRSSELGMVLAAVLATMSAAFIVVTGLTTSVAQRQRELAIVRCVGGTRAQLAGAQLLIGVTLGAVGAIVGVPLGIGIAAALAWVFSKQLAVGLVVSWGGIGLGVMCALVSGALGGAWPAVLASRVSPLKAMASRAQPARLRGIAIVTAMGLVGLAIQAGTVVLPRDSQVAFWSYATTGLPAMVIGYFLLGVPLMYVAAAVVAPVVSSLLRLPRRMLGRTVRGTVYRFGFTAGAMMAGLGLMVAIWTNGGAILRDWLGKLEFPDAFVNGPALSSDVQRTLESLDFVDGTCAIATYPIKTDAFGVRALQSYQTTFIAFEPRKFFDMTRVAWVQGDQASAIAGLEAGGGVIVAREFMVAQGLGVGDTFHCEADGREHDFEIVGVVASPGLEVVSKFFNIGEEFHQQALHAVFGSMRDLKEKFGSDVVHLIQIDIADDVDDAWAMNEIDRALLPYPIYDSGSGKRIKEEIRGYATGSLMVMSAVAMAAVFVASFGVANVIVAGIDARRHEFGVLRAVGGTRSVLMRLVIGEALLVAVVACVLGTAMGIQGSWAAHNLYRLLLGLLLELRPAWGAIGVSCLVVLVFALGAAWPAVWRLGRQEPRELLGRY